MTKSFSEAEWKTCIKVLQVLSRKPESALDEMVLKGLVTKLSKQAKKRLRAEAAQADRETVAGCKLRQSNIVSNHPLRNSPQIQPRPEIITRRLTTPRNCYACKQLFFDVHHHYHMHCPACAERHYQKRSQRADLFGRTALLTGGRIKIGWQLALRLLRDGARVILTTRFPHDAARRFGNESDFGEWQDRLSIHGLDLRDLPKVEAFAQHLSQSEPSLDILINNAAQTIRRSSDFYEHLRAGEMEALPNHLGPLLPALAPLPERKTGELLAAPAGNLEWFPRGVLDRDGQQVDLSPKNSWTNRACDISTAELLEALLINQSSPFILAARLRPLLAKSKATPRFIVNVSAMEGQFGRKSKTAHHPHTNMAKAALNMFTRTSAQDFAQDGIWMNSVDTGWITDENPFPKKTRMLEEQDFVPPLDAIDGMARVYDPIVQGITHPEREYLGHFLKDYQPHPW